MALESVGLRIFLQQSHPTFRVVYSVGSHVYSHYSSYPLANAIFTNGIPGKCEPPDDVFAAGEPTYVFSDCG